MSAVESEETNPYGVSDEDYEAGAAAEQAAIEECMAAAGWPYDQEAPDDLIVTPSERGPAWGLSAALLRAIDSSRQEVAEESRIPDSVRPQEQDAWAEQVGVCAERVFSETERRQAAVGADRARIDEAWEDFRSSAAYLDAVFAWAECMRQNGFPAENPERVSDPISNRLQRIAQEMGHEIASFDRSAALALQQDEIVLFDTDQDCRLDTLDPLEQEFKRRLLDSEAAAVAAIRRAIRSD